MHVRDDVGDHVLQEGVMDFAEWLVLWLAL